MINQTSFIGKTYLYILVLFSTISWLSAFPQDTTLLPDDFPVLEVLTSDDPEPGYIFMAPGGLFGSFIGSTPYLVIADNYGTPVYYLKLTLPAFDFKLQPNGLLSFFNGGFGYWHHFMDPFMRIVDSISVTGYDGTDFHDIQLLDNGHFLLLGYDDQVVDMDTVVPGGYPGVLVRGAIIQEQDSSRQVVWEWSSWEHFEITDANEDIVDLLDSNFIDYVHANAVEQDSDTTLLLSSRNLEEITKIHKPTGDIIWRMGGENNQFTFTGGDTLGFYAQHDIRYLGDSIYTLFDNGWEQPGPFSSGVEYKIDEEAKTAFLVKRYRSQPDDILGWVMGNCQRLPGGNTMIGWGSGLPNFTEFRPDGTKALEMQYERVSYRTFKFEWEMERIHFDTDTLDFGTMGPGDDATLDITVCNADTLEHFVITDIISRSGLFECLDELPDTIPVGDSAVLHIRFNAQDTGSVKDVLTFCWNTDDENLVRRLARQVDARAEVMLGYGIIENLQANFTLRPNPATSLVTVRFGLQEASRMKAVLFNQLGQPVYSLAARNFPAGTNHFSFSVEGLPEGIYFLMLQSDRGTACKKVLVKGE